MNTKTLQTVNIDGREYITVKQYADEIGVTTSAVYQTLKRDTDGTGLTRYQHTVRKGNKDYQYIDVAALDDVVSKTDKELLTDNQDLMVENNRLLNELMEEKMRANEMKKTFDEQTDLMNRMFDELKRDNDRKQEQIVSLTNQLEDLKTIIQSKDNQIAALTQSLDERYAESNRIHYATATANNQRPGMFDRLFKRKRIDSDVFEHNL